MLSLLKKEQVICFYGTRLKKDFPSDELKPLEAILFCMDKGIYEPLSFETDNNTVGYCFLIRKDKNYLIDYLAIDRDFRDRGYGSLLLKEIKEYLKDAGSVIVEIEDPDGFDDRMVHRRYDFYLRNGFHDTSVSVNCFSVQYLLMTLGDNMDENEVKEVYSSIYRSSMSKELYDENIRI